MDLCICVTDSLCSIAATNTTLSTTYPPIKIKNKKKERTEAEGGFVLMEAEMHMMHHSSGKPRVARTGRDKGSPLHASMRDLRYADDTTLMAESEEEIMMKVKEESEKVGSKLNIQKTKIMASSPITSWQIDGETMETMADFIFWGSKITADGDGSREIKRYLLLGRKVTTNLDSILKSRDITLPTNVHLVKAMVFPVVMYGCESWTVKKAGHQRIDAFELWWRRLLKVP